MSEQKRILVSLQRSMASLINNPELDEKTIRFKFSNSNLFQIDQQLQHHRLYSFAVDLITKNVSENQFQCCLSTRQVKFNREY